MAAAPREERPRWLAAFSSAGGLSFAAAALVSGAAAQRFAPTFRLAGRTLGSLHAVFLVGAIARVLAALLGLRLLSPVPVQAAGATDRSLPAPRQR